MKFLKFLKFLCVILMSNLVLNCDFAESANVKTIDCENSFNDIPLKCKCEIADGQKNGKEMCYDSLGQLYYIAEYKNGKKDGKFVAYHDNKEPNVVLSFKNGKVTGEGGEFYANGKFKAYYFTLQQDSLKGSPSYLKEYDETGGLKGLRYPVNIDSPKRCFAGDTCSINFELKYSEYSNCDIKILLDFNDNGKWNDSLYSETMNAHYTFIPKAFGLNNISGRFYEIEGDSKQIGGWQPFEFSIIVK